MAAADGGGGWMFVLSVIKDTVSIHPSNFGAPPAEAIINSLNSKYANRVLRGVGLCICVFDLVSVGEGKVRFGDGMLWYKVALRLVVFRPTPSEVILAKVKSSDEHGIRISVGFFDDMYIPAEYLPTPSAFDPNERAYFWVSTAGDEPISHLLDTPVADRMYVDSGEIVRVRVETDEFFDDEPGPPNAQKNSTATRASRPPFVITCSMAEAGLGPTVWWKSQDQYADADGDADMEENQG